MKIKLLLVPSTIVIIITLLIWVVYPAYTTPESGSGVREKSALLKTEEAKLLNIEEKSDVIKRLSRELSSDMMASKRSMVMDFLPDSIKEYEIIDNLNYLILKEEIFGMTISVSQPAAEVAVSPAETSSQSGGVGVVPTEVRPQATTFKVNVTAQGSYGKIKDLFQKIYGLKRFNRILTIKIDPESPEKSGSDNLKASASLEFSYLKGSGTFTTIDDSVFSKTTFDSRVIDDIEKKRETSLLPGLQVDQKGRPNPFAL